MAITQSASNPPAWPHPVHALHNRRAAPLDAAYGPDLQAILSLAAHDAAWREIMTWPGYEATPLIALPGLARALGIAALHVKDEGRRFGLESFKALGGAYAVQHLLADAVEKVTGRRPDSAALRRGEFASITSKIVVTTATDGNHGRSVAWGAKVFGCRAVIFVPDHCPPARRQAIAAFGAEVVQSDVGYDDTVRLCTKDALAHGRLLISDTSWPGYEQTPKLVMQGYSVMAEEILRQTEGEPPTHAFLQAGVGGLAAALAAHFWERLGPQRPLIAVVQPVDSACLFSSAEAGRAVPFPREVHTEMACLAAGEPSILAWPILERATETFMTVPDAVIPAAMRLLADSPYGDPPIVAGNSAIAGLAALLSSSRTPALRGLLKMNESSRILLIASEGAADPEAYRSIVGRTAGAVRGEAA